MEEEIHSLLSSLGHPVAWGSLGSGTSLPRVVLSKVSGSERVTLDGPVGKIVARVQIDCYGDALREAGQLGYAIRGLLSGYAGGVITFARLEGIRDGRDGSDGDAIPRMSLDFAVHYRV